MPETRFQVRWPDRSATACYSPSSTVREFFTTGTAYSLDEFLDRSRRALAHASRRVEQKYGFACTAASAELARIEHAAAAFTHHPDPTVTVESFEP